MVETDLAKKLIASILNLIKPENKYPEVIKQIVKNAKQEINTRYNQSGRPIFGVFGKDGSFILRKGVEPGKKLRARIAKNICREFQSVVVTGDAVYHYVKRTRKIKSQSIILEKIRGQIKKEDNWATTFSKIVGQIPDSAVFLIDKDRSASIHEEGAFHETNSLSGIAVVMSSNEIIPCKYLSVIEYQRLKYAKCYTKEYDNCTKPKSRCALKRLGINKTSIEPFIKTTRNSCIIVDSVSKIEDIVILELKQNITKKVLSKP